MKAAQFSQYGDPSVLAIVAIPVPEPAPNQVVVRVHAASLNPFDTTIRSGAMRDAVPLHLPVTLGGDIAGTITAIGGDVTSFAVGDAVYGQANVVGGNSGAFAEFAATKTSQIAYKPKHTDFIQAAALPLVGVSALQGLTEHIHLSTGSRLFIHGGAGGIGKVAIQIAKHLGAYIATTATGDQIAVVKALGADEVVDYKTTDFAEVLRDFDAVFDTVGKDDFVKSYQILKPGGVAVSMIAPPNAEIAKKHGITAFMQGTKTTTAHLDELTKLVESGAVTAHVAKTYPLADVQAAFRDRESGGVNGKIVLTIND